MVTTESFGPAGAGGDAGATDRPAPAHPLRATVLDELATLVAFPSVSRTPNGALVDHLQDVMEGLGATCVRTWDPSGQRANLLATIGPDGDGGVVLSGHTDVVPAEDVLSWATSPWELVVTQDRAYGRGATDMKGFVAAMVAIAPMLAATDLARPVHLAFSFDEEVGCLGAQIMLADMAERGIRPAAAIVGEPTSMDVVTAHKGINEYTTTIFGLAGHGSQPDHSVNAIWHAARYVMKLHDLAERLRDRASADSPFDPPETTLSIGRIHGGQLRNVVPAACSFDWEYRPATDADTAYVAAEVAALEDEMQAELARLHPDAGLVRTSDGVVPGLYADPDSAALALVLGLLDDPDTTTSPYCAEAGLFQQAGIPAVVCGPGSIDQAHRVDEYVDLVQLDECLDMLERLVDELAS